MNLLVVEGHNHATTYKDADFCIEQLIGYTCRLRILTDALMGSLLQSLCIIEKVAAIVFINSGLANLQTVFMPIVVDGKNIDQLGFQ